MGWRFRRPPWPAIALSLVAVVAIAAGLLFALDRGRPSHAQGAHPPPAQVTQPPSAAGQRVQPTALVLGDSFAVGVGADTRSHGFPHLLAAAMNWQLVLDAQSGSGYVQRGSSSPGRATYVDRSARRRGQRFDFALVTGGINDRALLRSGVTAAEYATAVGTVLDNLGGTVPPGRLIVVGPFWPDSAPSAEILRLRDEIKAQAAARGLLFLDPIADGWVTAANQGQVTGRDGLHPTQAGHQLLADDLARALRALGIEPARTG